jgi:putative redox protein
MIEVKMKWGGGLRFEGESAFGHTMVTDAAKQAGGDESGFKPTELLLFGLAACTGVDIVRIMQKQRQKMSALEIEVRAHQNDNYPKPFHTFEIKYFAYGEGLDERKLARAIELSEAKYCVISQTLMTQADVKCSFEIIPE